MNVISLQCGPRRIRNSTNFRIGSTLKRVNRSLSTVVLQERCRDKGGKITRYVLRGGPFRRASLASNRSFISLISLMSSCNFFGSCSTAACSHSTLQRSLFVLALVPPRRRIEHIRQSSLFNMGHRDCYLKYPIVFLIFCWYGTAQYGASSSLAVTEREVTDVQEHGTRSTSNIGCR